jgi:hypothetical protein
VDQDQAAALFDQPFQVGSSLALVRQRLLVAEMEKDHVMVEHGIGREDVGVLDDPHDATAVLLEKAAEGGRGFFPVVGRMVHAGDEENADRGGRLIFILDHAAHEGGDQGRQDERGHVVSPFERMSPGRVGVLAWK